MQHGFNRRLSALVAAAAGLALGAATALTPAGVAAPSAPAAAAPAAQAGLPGMRLLPSAPDRSASASIQNGGNHSYDINLDGWDDITARQSGTGVLNVYPHSQSFNGTATFQPPVTAGFGWGIMNWLTPGYVNADGAPDILARRFDGQLLAYPHSGSFSGTGTFTPPTLVGYGWNLHNILYLDDWNGDGFDDILARPSGSNEIWLYFHAGAFSGTSTYQPPIPVIDGAFFDTWESMSDVTGDGFTDLVYRLNDGTLGMFDIETGVDYVLGFGWNINDRMLINDVDRDGFSDIVARRASDGTLHVYRHRGFFDPGDPVATIQAPVLLGYGWWINDIIT